jgi:hypothetical protein
MRRIAHPLLTACAKAVRLGPASREAPTRTRFLGLCLVLWGCLLSASNGSEAGNTVIVGDAKLQITLNLDEKGLVEDGYETLGVRLPATTGIPWAVETEDGILLPARALARPEKSAPVLSSRATFEGSLDTVDWRLDYELADLGTIRKTLTLTPKRDLLLKRVSLWKCRSDVVPVVSRTSLQDIAALYRHGPEGMFVSLDFPYSRIACESGETSVAYPPYKKLKGGEPYVCHTLTVGATALTGRMRYGFDEGEVEAMDSYIQKRFPPRFNRPMFATACINNRYTMVQGDVVFYTMKDHPTLSFNADLLKREIALLPQIGMEYYQVWTGPFDSVPGDPDPKFVKEIVDFAAKHGVRVGDYSGADSIFCPHYNEYRNTLENHPEWGIKPCDVCFGNPKFVTFYKNMVVENDKRYGFEVHILDFLNIRECNATDHDHLPGPDSIYAQVRGLVEILEGINDVSPNMMTWSNSGNWAEFLPKIAWTNHNLYLTDPFIASPWQGLNMTRLLDDARREQMVSLHYSRFLPYRYLTNCQYFFSQNAIVPDIRNYRYGALATVAVTPNLCLAEVRPWLDKLTDNRRQEVLDFYKKWTSFLATNYDLWKTTYQVGENPGMGSVEIYGHAQGDHGFIFLINPQYWDRTVEVPLDASLGFSGAGKCEIAELYPVERLKLTAQGPFPPLGAKIPVRVPAQTVVVLEVRPAPTRIDKPTMYGLPGTVEASEDGCLVKTRGPQGRTERCVVLLPDGGKPIASANVRDVPKQPKRLWSPTQCKFVAGNDSGVAMDVTFRRDAAPDELRGWEVKPGNLTSGEAAGWANGFKDGAGLVFPLFVDVADNAVQMPMWDATADQLGLGPLANFCGAYIDNAFSETQETWIDLKTGEQADIPAGPLLGSESAPKARPMPETARDTSGSWWVQTSFHLPFMYTLGAEPFFDEHVFLVLPFLRQSRIGQVKAWINGAPLEVRKYLYPRNRGLSCFYADLVGSGACGGRENTLVVYFEAK